MTIAEESKEEVPKQEFKLVKRCYDEIWLAQRVPDGKQFIARKITEFDAYLSAVAEGTVLDEHALEDRGVIELMFHHSQARSLSMLFNHENIVSIAGTIRTTPLKAPKSMVDEYIVWDFCDAGTLFDVLQEKSIVRKPGYWLPESLCWHVLKAVMRALTWLHTGTRRYFDGWNGMMWPEQRDLDWHPILHRAVNSENIFFQHPSGTETYGLCKLGNLQHAFVSGKYGGSVSSSDWVKPYDPHRPLCVAMQSGIHSLKRLRDKVTGSPLDQPPVSNIRIPRSRGP
jgi:serine/threonine protein kinase